MSLFKVSLLNIRQGIGLKHTASLDTSSPFFNNIRVLSGEYSAADIKIRYLHGDEVNILFWKSLWIDIGGDLTTQLQLQDGYTYIYHMKDKIFKVIDNLGATILTKTNIQSMADMNISFEIYKSHQFIIVLDLTKYYNHFFLCAKLEARDYFIEMFDELIGIHNTDPDYRHFPYEHKFFGEIPKMLFANSNYIRNTSANKVREIVSLYNFKQKIKVMNGIVADTLDDITVGGVPIWFRPPNPGDPGDSYIPLPPKIEKEKCYDKGDFVLGNPEVVSESKSNMIYSIFNVPSCCDKDGGEGIGSGLVVTIKDKSDILKGEVGKDYIIGNIIEYDGYYYRVYKDFKFEEIGLAPIEKICVLMMEIMKVKIFTFIRAELRFLMPKISISLLANLQSIIRVGETQNNRPIYEPWLIYGAYRFVHTIITQDLSNNKNEVFAFDLSPAW